ncbi:MAG: NAD(P)/FAD-dependent oxidoreductase [Gammaproteobacteria bacterium]
MKIAVIGAGMAGLTAARTLSSQHEVVVFEKSRGVGGRIATRQQEAFFFDHGAQFFAAKTPVFRDFIAPYQAAGVVSVWKGHFQERTAQGVLSEREWEDEPAHFVGSPSMNAFPKALAEGLDVRRMIRIQGLERTEASWSLFADDDQCFAGFDWVVIAIPVAQARALIPSGIAFQSSLQAIEMQACYSLMLGFNEPMTFGFDAALIHEADISWISVNSSKPGRSPYPTLLVHSTNRWAEAHVDLPRAQVIEHLLQETETHVGPVVHQAVHVDVQRWLYANAEKRVDAEPCLLDRNQQIIACGDWCIHGRIEAAFLSGQAAAAEITQ